MKPNPRTGRWSNLPTGHPNSTLTEPPGPYRGVRNETGKRLSWWRRIFGQG